MSGSILLLAALEMFPDGAVEWRGTIACPDPMALQDASVVLAFDFDLDGSADGEKDSIPLSPPDCDGGEVRVLRTLFPGRPGLLLSELRRGDGGSEQHVAFAGATGSLLSLRHFCARPSGGEPEWVELRNAADRRLDLRKVRLQNHLLGGWLDPGESVVLGSDSAAVQRWVPAFPARSTAWSYLRNTGDTLRLTWGDAFLDSAIYGENAKEPREACASDAGSGGAAGSGFDLRIASPHWNPASGPVDIEVEVPAGTPFVLPVYDLDGFSLCVIARGSGPVKFSLSVSDCPRLSGRSGPVILNLQPRGAAPRRKILMLDRPW